ncbi:MAG TPA: two-component sensor histidine kinase, partial [Mobilitalea sp.]|nr:two-component sensor histidine kinase [Mobilitalea sp.]
MRRAIFQKFILILSLALIISGSIFGVTTSNIILDKTRESMLYILRGVDYALKYDLQLKPQLEYFKAVETKEDARFTVMDLKGNILADSDVDSATVLENHADREEVMEAVQYGVGDARRKSETLNVSMLYVSCPSENGEYLLRMAVPFSGLLEYAGLLLPAILISIGISLLISIILANRFSGTITQP